MSTEPTKEQIQNAVNVVKRAYHIMLGNQQMMNTLMSAPDEEKDQFSIKVAHHSICMLAYVLGVPLGVMPEIQGSTEAMQQLEVMGQLIMAGDNN